MFSFGIFPFFVRVSSLCNLIDAKELTVQLCVTLEITFIIASLLQYSLCICRPPSLPPPQAHSTQKGGGFGRMLLPGPRSVTVSTSPARCYSRVCRGGNISVRPPQSQSLNEKTHAHYVSTHGTKLDHKWMNMMLHMLMFRDILMDCLSVFLYETLHLRPVIHQGRSKC